MKKLSLLVFLFIINIINAQESKEFRKFKCLKDKMASLENVLALDTIFILYYKSDIKGSLQGYYEAKYYLENRYVFENISVSTQIYDFKEDEKVNYRDPIIMYKNKSYICKNRKRIITGKFFMDYWTYIFDQIGRVKPMLFVIDLDQKIKNKYKIIQVNHPTFTVE